MEVFSKFWSIIIGFIIMFICPIYIAEMRTEALADIEFVNYTDRFLDKIKYTGYLDRKELDNFYLNFPLIKKNKEIKIIHKRRAVRPVYKNGEISDTSEFYIEVSYDEIKEKLKSNNKYKFKIGDEICCIIKNNGKLFNLFPEKTIELGGMIENEYIEN